MSTPDADRLAAILETEERVRIEAEEGCRIAAEEIVAAARAMLALWESRDEDRERGLLHLGGIDSLCAEYRGLWQQRAMRAMGAAPQPSEHYTREDRQKITGKRVYGLRKSTTDPEDEA